MNWINVEDRLPDNDDEVFIYPYKNKWPKWQMFASYEKIKNVWLSNDDDGYDIMRQSVTHWMPLPESIKEK